MNMYGICMRQTLVGAAILQLACGLAMAASVTLVAGDASARSGTEVVVPVTAESAQKMGALMLDDPIRNDASRTIRRRGPRWKAT